LVSASAVLDEANRNPSLLAMHGVAQSADRASSFRHGPATGSR
jgi:hypothetical protein